MEYLSSLEVATELGLTKRMVNLKCAKGEYQGAFKQGNRWMIPSDALSTKKSESKRSFNSTGICLPSLHYMVDLDERLKKMTSLVDAGHYFTVNRARQFGKTTTLFALEKHLNQKYFVISMDFQMQMSHAKFKDEHTFSLAFAKSFEKSFLANSKSSMDKNVQAINAFSLSYHENIDNYELVELFQDLSLLCGRLDMKAVLIIDEVDSATNNQVFLDFLAQLRGYYLHKDRFATFKSVILSGVCDVKNLRRKLRPDQEHRDNSPWNIAIDFDMDMSFSQMQIANMIKEYQIDYDMEMDYMVIAKEIHDYTSGYPFLVSRLCQIMDDNAKEEHSHSWTHETLLSALRQLLLESNSLFDDLSKKIKDYPTLRQMIYDMLFTGKSIPFNISTELISIGYMYGFLKNVDGQATISNRIFEIWLYNLFIAEEAMNNETYVAGQLNKPQFIHNGELNLEMILRRFVEHYTECFGHSDAAFLEENARKIFLLYIRPLINGIGNYYIEAQTRSLKRTDLIIDYLGKQYIIEMKIWHGEEYHHRGEKQLIGYLDDYGIKKGYLLSFNFNKDKQIGVKEIHLDDYTIIEAVV